VPGQVINREVIEALNSYRDYHVEIHGLKEGRIKVLTKAEETQLEEYGYRIFDISES
jgi:arginine/lysine/ornithine decarboxylase